MQQIIKSNAKNDYAILFIFFQAEPDESTTKVREEKEVINADQLRESSEINDKAKIEETDVEHEESDKPKTLCIVVDTNIFIDNLSKLKDILEVKTEGNLFNIYIQG